MNIPLFPAELATGTGSSAEEEAFFFGNTRVTFLASAFAGDGLCVIEHRMPYGESPPLHIHRNEDELFLLLEGRMRFRARDTTRILEAGQTFLVPEGTPHTFRVESPEGARCLTVTSGGDFEAMVRAVGRPATGPDLPVWSEPTAERVFTLGRACALHGIDVIGAPLG
jgi:mannose-6-phosphate isomerase-like protein (cupin superfamily)